MGLRRWVNDRHGRWSARRANRAVYNQRVLLVSNHWEGSVQQFYHFMFGYLLPVAVWIREHPGTPIAMRDCGPMQPWLDLLAQQVDLEIMPPGAALHVVVGDRMAHRVLPGWDDPSTFNRPRLLAGASALRAALHLPDPDATAAKATVVLDRATSEDFYHGTQSETHMSGSERRSTPNLAGLAADPELDVLLIDLAQVAPAEQITLMQRADVLVGQHGAGLLHMIWMASGSSVIEIAPPLPPEVEDLFRDLARCLGHRYIRVAQDSVHSPVALEAVAGAISDARAGTQ